ncbi:MAG: hypothetical protein GX283_04765 [Clostridiaceae bacterium]|nr:hypothetical protein [Clostridiaceae bacterium]
MLTMDILGDLFQNIPVYHGGDEHKYFDCNNESVMLHISNTSKQEYDNYLLLLEEAGFKLFDSNTIRDNYFATYTRSSLVLQVYHTAHDKVTRVVADPKTALYNRTKDSTFEKICDTVMYQLELDYRNIDCGMCYVIQCADHSFFIIDSAHMFSSNDHNRLYNLLRKLTPEGEKIIISGWFFTHAHQDHIAMFMSFLEADFENCQIERLYYNFPALDIPGSEKWKELDKETMREFDQLIENHSEIQVVKLHTGQRFFVKNLEFEVLATHEDIYPASLGYFNDSSTILLMTVDGCKTLLLGDSNYTECTILVSRYGSYLKSDIVQVAHHGYNASNVGVYFCADAKVSLYSTPLKRYEQIKSTSSNKVIHEISEEIYIAENGTASLKLPYTPGSAVVFPKEINDI